MYGIEILDENEDDGTMPDNVEKLEDAIVGRKIVSAERRKVDLYRNVTEEAFVITLDDGRQVELVGSGDCCAYTELHSFFLNPELVDHVILGVGTTNEYQTWHIYADLGDILKLDVSWSAGNIGYYGYGFDIRVKDLSNED